METLPEPQIIRCFFDRNATPHLPAMELRWDADTPSVADGIWHLPGNVVLKGPAPERFGITVRRVDFVNFRVRVLWNELSLHWESLSRTQIMTSSLAPVLRALGTDLWYLLEQPVDEEAFAAAA
jgi:hypothetical protein